MYVWFGVQKQGYANGLRPIISLDGCHIKTSMGGQILGAVARDGKNNMVPHAFLIVDIKCKESWSWFLSLLLEDFGNTD